VPDKDVLIEHLRECLAPYKIPARWFAAAEFPVTPTGKVRKFALRDAVIRGEVAEL
jgi:fatty-acyl-CoA synthase